MRSSVRVDDNSHDLSWVQGVTPATLPPPTPLHPRTVLSMRGTATGSWRGTTWSPPSNSVVRHQARVEPTLVINKTLAGRPERGKFSTMDSTKPPTRQVPGWPPPALNWGLPAPQDTGSWKWTSSHQRLYRTAYSCVQAKVSGWNGEARKDCGNAGPGSTTTSPSSKDFPISHKPKLPGRRRRHRGEIPPRLNAAANRGHGDSTRSTSWTRDHLKFPRLPQHRQCIIYYHHGKQFCVRTTQREQNRPVAKSKAKPPQPPQTSSGSETETSWPSEDPQPDNDNNVLLQSLITATATSAEATDDTDATILMQKRASPGINPAASRCLGPPPDGRRRSLVLCSRQL